MKKIFPLITFIAVFLSSAASNSKDKPLPVLVAHESQVKIEEISELSGICLSNEGDFLFGVDDGGGVYRINVDDGYTVSRLWKKSGEMEGVALNPENGDLYIGLENSKKFAYQVKSIDSEYDFENALPLRLDDKGFKLGNKGVEGIAFYKGNLYLGTQAGANLYHYNLESAELSEPKSLKQINGCDIKEIAGLDYDEENDWLWAIDSKRRKIYLFDGDGSELLSDYYIGDSAKNNPEGLCVDKKRKCIWVCEESEKKSILHKYSFDGL